MPVSISRVLRYSTIRLMLTLAGPVEVCGASSTGDNMVNQEKLIAPLFS